jgi:hypothetical protein
VHTPALKSLAFVVACVAAFGCGGSPPSTLSPAFSEFMPVAQPANEPPLCAMWLVKPGNRVIGPGEKDDPLGPAVCIWDDGRVLWNPTNPWSRDAVVCGTLTPEQVRDVHQRVLEGFRALGNVRTSHYPPDSSYLAIFARDGDTYRVLKSTHDLLASGDLIATDHGIEALNGRDRAAVLAGTPPEYRHFLEQWAVCRDALTPVRPVVSGADCAWWSLAWVESGTKR